MKQNTIEREISFSGIGLHTGFTVNITLKPANSDMGIIFRRIDLEKNNEVKALYSNVSNTMLGTVIENKNAKIQTIEHLMSAIWATNIDNLIIEIDNYEVPIMDGSAILFIKKIQEAGIVEQDSYRKYLTIKKTVTLQESNKLFEIVPADDFKVSLLVEYNYGGIGKQEYNFDGTQETFINDISLARTFCNFTEIENMKRVGFAMGGFAIMDKPIVKKKNSLLSLFRKNRASDESINLSKGDDIMENAAVYGDDGILNKSGLRCENEVVRHKMIDLIGDLFTSGYYVKGHIRAVWNGHTLHNKFLKLLFLSNDNYEIK
ncbi:MAG: UDP-3-O-acyl-N-acetylglucosamine deacetylase [Rickettsiales bacterium]|jgi:UDP-3-O-acyl N-acetylglucosamine deacetylase|nr:UDP-3-O-acyl-N-acetylglucosamine deacetylase [Rickettsiales bacterium]